MEQNRMDLLPLQLGKILANFHSLERLMRWYLCNAEGSDEWGWMTARAGSTVPATANTKYAYFSKVLDDYNKIVEKKDATLAVPASLKALRNVIAHGFTVQVTGENHWRLIKFDHKPGVPDATVEMNQIVTQEWAEQANGMVRDAIITVGQARDRHFLGIKEDRKDKEQILDIAEQAIKKFENLPSRPPHVTMVEAGEMLGMSAYHVRKLLYSGRLKLNGCGRIPIDLIDRIIAAGDAPNASGE